MKCFCSIPKFPSDARLILLNLHGLHLLLGCSETLAVPSPVVRGSPEKQAFAQRHGGTYRTVTPASDRFRQLLDRSDRYITERGAKNRFSTSQCQYRTYLITVLPAEETQHLQSNIVLLMLQKTAVNQDRQIGFRFGGLASRCFRKFRKPTGSESA